MNKDKMDGQELDWKQEIVLYVKEFISLLTVLVIVFLVFFRVIVVSGSSMYNTLSDGDYLILISRVFYREPEHGDIIVASKESHENGAPVIKRVIATAGQIVDIDFDAGVVYVDGEALEEPYAYTATNVKEGMAFPLMVEENCIFVMGDNRNRSKDSRHPDIGMIDKREILGKAVFLVFPGMDMETFSRDFNRIGALK